MWNSFAQNRRLATSLLAKQYDIAERRDISLNRKIKEITKIIDELWKAEGLQMNELAEFRSGITDILAASNGHLTMLKQDALLSKVQKYHYENQKIIHEMERKQLKKDRHQRQSRRSTRDRRERNGRYNYY